MKRQALGSADYVAFIERDIRRWGPVVKAAKLEPN
jgi:hypothetical protein